jgi:hypothetical protein
MITCIIFVQKSMEVSSSIKRRIFRGKPAILELLREQQQSGLSIQAFCVRHSLASGNFHNWMKKYSVRVDQVTEQSFTPFQIMTLTSLQLFVK